VVITGLAHSGVCVPDCEAAVAFYRDVLGMRVLSPPYVMADDAIREDMGQLVADPTMKAAIVGFDDDGDRVLEVIESWASRAAISEAPQPLRTSVCHTSD
jgi:methylmalonyl-CoA/ethylmalonyl-CoA epimerase